MWYNSNTTVVVCCCTVASLGLNLVSAALAAQTPLFFWFSELPVRVPGSKVTCGPIEDETPWLWMEWARAQRVHLQGSAGLTGPPAGESSAGPVWPLAWVLDQFGPGQSLTVVMVQHKGSWEAVERKQWAEQRPLFVYIMKLRLLLPSWCWGESSRLIGWGCVNERDVSERQEAANVSAARAQ